MKLRNVKFKFRNKGHTKLSVVKFLLGKELLLFVIVYDSCEMNKYVFSVCFCVFPSVSVCLCVGISFCRSEHVSVRESVCVSEYLCQSVCLSVCLSA